MKLTYKELKQIKAGAAFTATMMNALIKGFNSFMDIGRYFGSSIRRLVGGSSCPLR